MMKSPVLCDRCDACVTPKHVTVSYEKTLIFKTLPFCMTGMTLNIYFKIVSNKYTHILHVYIYMCARAVIRGILHPSNMFLLNNWCDTGRLRLSYRTLFGVTRRITRQKPTTCSDHREYAV